MAAGTLQCPLNDKPPGRYDGLAIAQLEQFLRSPGDSRYGRAATLARAMRRQEEAEDQQYNEQQHSAPDQLPSCPR